MRIGLWSLARLSPTHTSMVSGYIAIVLEYERVFAEHAGRPHLNHYKMEKVGADFRMIHTENLTVINT